MSAARPPDRLDLRAREEVALLVSAVTTPLVLAVGLAIPLLAAPTPLLLALLPLRRRVRDALTPGLELALSLAALLAALATATLTRDAPLGLAVFLLAALALKAIAPRQDRDRGTAAAVVLVLTAVAAADAVDLVFAPLLGVNLFALTWFALARAPQGESPPPGATPCVAGAGRGRRAAVIVGLLALAALGAAGFFFACPRLGVRLLASQRRDTTQRLSGFTEDVGLDDFGKIKQDHRVALRVELGEGSPLFAEGPYWRGRALDHYENGTWRLTADMRREPLVWADGAFHNPFQRPGAGELGAALFVVEALDTDTVFTVGVPDALEFRGGNPRRVTCDAMGNLSARDTRGRSRSYEVRAWRGGPGERELAPSYAARLERLCLQLPREVDRARLRTLASEVVARAGAEGGPPSRAARALEAYLAARYEYTTVSERTPGTEPIEDFLFVRRAGHCELFASAHVLLLRTLGIPARLITGLRGGELSEWTHSYVVRQSNAHAWVEARTERGWERFDPTPADPAPETGSALPAALQELREWLEMQWLLRVVTFDAYDQRNALRAAWQALAAARAAWGTAALGALALGALALTGALGVALRRALAAGGPARAPGAGGPPRDELLARLLAALAARGYVRAAGETPRELAARASPALGALGPRAHAVIERYYGGRFGGAPLNEVERRAARALADELREARTPGAP